MPGAVAGDLDESWFEDRFGFAETTYYPTRQKFDMLDDVLVSKPSRKRFHVGAFEVLRLEQLQSRLAHATIPEDLGGLTFQNCIADVRAMHLDPANAGAVFQVMSQFNCLQMTDEKCRPEMGIKSYALDTSQGAACALACPAGLVYRNYLYNSVGQGYTGQIDCLSGVGSVVSNRINGYWRMQSGFCMPSFGGIPTLGNIIEENKETAELMHKGLQVGIHWDTEVDGGSHRVCQVFSSAAPISQTKRACSADDWAPFARLLLAATFDATLTVATKLAATHKKRIRVFLTTVGSGAFGNREAWVAEGIEKALRAHAKSPLDVVLAHCASIPEPYKVLEEGRDAPEIAIATGPVARVPSKPDATATADSSVGERITAIYKKFDANGDGIVDMTEFSAALRKLDPTFFTPDVVQKLLLAADANADGKVHYAEFTAWVTGEDSSVTTRLLSTTSMGSADDGTAPPESLPDDAYKKAIKMCQEWDLDHDGSISDTEMKKAMRDSFPKWTTHQIEALVEAVDLNGDGMIPFEEFLQWLKQEPKERLSFEDFFKDSLVARAADAGPPPGHAEPGAPDGGAESGTGVPGSGPATGAHSAGAGTGSGGPTTGKSTSGAAESEDDGLELFVHPLLERFGVKDDRLAAADRSSVTVETKRSSLYSYSSHSTRAHSSSSDNLKVKRNASGGLVIEITSPTVKASHGGLLLPLLVTLAEAYGNVFEAFLESRASSSVSAHSPMAPPKLRLAPIKAVDTYSLSLDHQPNVTIAAISLALARLSAENQDAFASCNVELFCGIHDDYRGHHRALEKDKDSSSVLRLEEAGRMKSGPGYTYLRKANDEEARLVRLSAFMGTQRAISGRGYEIKGSMVALSNVEDMVRNTKVRFAKDIEVGRAPAGKTTRLETTELTVMEASQQLAEKGYEVAALNAASAYHAGGGCSSGGRHALEEAWCTISTLFRSLLAVENVPTGSSGHQHIPTLGCIVSPKVEIFREPTNEGYGFLSKPVQLCGVLSIALFNRNPSVSDSPLDSPADPADYVTQTIAKLEACLLSAIDLGAKILVMTDVGCGVFANDPIVVGGCTGALLKRYDGHLEEVCLCCHKQEFVDACQRAFKGEDPREPCEHGKYCNDLGDPVHCARFSHPPLGEEEAKEVDILSVLVELVANPKPVVKPMCRYGAHCRTMTTEHRSKYDHPEPEPYSYSHYGSRYGSTYGGGHSYGTSAHGGSTYYGGGSSSYGGGRTSYGGGSTSHGGGSTSYGAGSTSHGGGSTSYSGASTSYGGGSTSHSGSHGAGTAGGATSSGGADLERESSGTTGGGGRAMGHTASSGGSPSHGAASAGAATGGAASHGAASAGAATGGGADAAGDAAGPGYCPPISRTKSRPVCKWGEKCYNTNPKHLADFAHPWKEGETAEEADLRRKTTLVHEILTLAKDEQWMEVLKALRRNPDIVNIRPPERGYGIIHFACLQVRHAEVRTLVNDFKADLTLKTRDGETPLQVLEAGIKRTPPEVAIATKTKDEALVRFVKCKLRGLDDDDEDDKPSHTRSSGRVHTGGVHHTASGGASHTASASGGFGVTGHSVGSSEAHSKKPGGVKLEVCDCPRRDLEGDFFELVEKYNHRPVYMKSVGHAKVFIFFHERAIYGWVMSSSLDSSQPLAYLRNSARLTDDPSDKPMGNHWRVLSKYAGIFNEATNMIMIRFPKRSSAGHYSSSL